jgi:DDE superfamily endonuclease
MDAAFFARMEDVLHLYGLPYNPKRPLLVFDERPCFLIGDVLTPIPMEAGMPKREHYEYAKNGSCTVFLAFEPATGQRWVKVFEKRSGLEYAKFMQYVSDQFKTVEKIVLVQDNLSTHNTSSFYSHLKPDVAFKLVQRPKPVRCWCWVKKKFEFHFTPVKSSWLNMAELELSVLSRQCLNRRIGSMAELERAVKAWVRARNKARVTVDWQFSIKLAREKFAAKYPVITN